MQKMKIGLIQMGLKASTDLEPDAIRDAMNEAHLPLIQRAADAGVQVLCFQEVFNQPYFCPSQDPKWYAAAERVPEGPTCRMMQQLAAEHRMVMVVPIYEETVTGVYYNTAAVFDADGSYLGKYHKTHIPQVAGFWEKYFFKPGNLGYPTFKTRYARIGVYICYDRHFPEGWRALALNGAEYIVNPSATVAGLSEHLWKLEQPASAVANGVYIGAINRIGTEAPWNIGEFYGQSYFVNPRGQIEAIASRDKDELLVHDMNFDMIREVRNTWQFFRDRRPETYDELTELPNRKQFERVLNEALERNVETEKKVALLLFDLDGFKSVNDAHGHNSGDRLLVEVARRLLPTFSDGVFLAELAQFALSADLQELFDRAAEVVAAALEAELSAIFEHLDGGGLFLRAGVGWRDGFASGYPQPLPVDDVGPAVGRSRLLDRHRVRGALTVAIPGPAEPLGAVAAYRRDEWAVTEDEQLLLQAIASVLGAAVVRAQTEEAVEQRERSFRTLTENSPDIVARFDRDLRHLYVNRVIEQKTGLPAESFIGKSNAELGLPEAQVRLWTEALESVFRTGQTATMEFSCPGPDGEELWFESRIIPETDSAGTVETAVGVTRDITERQREEHFRIEMIDQLRVLDAQRRRVLTQLVSAQEAERARIVPMSSR